MCVSGAVEVTISSALVPLIQSRGRMLPASPNGVRAKNWRLVSAIIGSSNLIAHINIPLLLFTISLVSLVSIPFSPI